MAACFVNAFRKIPWWAAIISVLLVADLVGRYVEFKWYGSSRAFARRFQVREIDEPGKEGGRCMSIFEHERPLVTECDLDRDGKIDAVEFYWQGRPVCDLVIKDVSSVVGRELEYWDN